MPRALVLLAALLAAGPARADRVDFARDVLPILSENCFHCHGPDDKARQAGLRLDTKEGAFAHRKKRVMLVAGKPDDSEVIRRISSTDEGEVMPPPESNRKLTRRQIETLRKWVEQGAPWGKHWAFVPPPRHVPAPAVRNAAWPRDPIDRFILARLEKEGLSPSPEADREAWLRRVTLDLTGLPPALADVEAFLADRAPDAYERVVDRLLASPRYAERMAADWLDLARFADTHGYQADRARPMWAYRDWVLRAFDRNQPFDQFLTEQLAGDLIPGATKEQRLATAFNRLHMQNEEGGVVDEEFRVAYVVDRVTTMGTVFLGLTFECSRCHDHKYDPLTMRDFYSLFAFFQNIDEAGQTSYFTNAMPVPTLLLSTDEQDAHLAALRRRVEARAAALAGERKKAAAAFGAWLKGRGETLPAIPGLVGAFSFDDWKGNAVANAADPKKPASAHDGPKPIAGKLGRGAELSGENGFNFPGVGHFSRSDPFTLSLWLRPAALAPRAVVLHHSRAPVDAGSRGYEVLLEGGRVALGLHHMWPGNSLKVRTRRAVAANAWVHVAVTYDGSSRAAGARIYLDGEPAELEVIRDGLWKDITYGGAEPNLALGFRFRDNGFKGGAVDQFLVHDRALTPLEVAHLAGKDDLKTAWSTPAEKLTAAQREALFVLFVATAHRPSLERTAQLRAARLEFARTIEPIPEAMVMQELPTPKPAFILRRGAYDAPGEKVTMATPAALPPWPQGAPRNRLGLAQWLTQPDHPLTARVTVNRFWQQLFGRGLVETSDNFGTTGLPPTHPELLDRLARDFVDGWDVKRLLRRIVLSATYRQSSRLTKELLARDPYNHLLARAPARRLSAEMIRDQALAVSGLLTERRGGPSIYPYQPEGLWNEAMGRPPYPRSKGPDLYRRGVYVFWKRTSPPPTLTTFDAADRSVCTAQRQSTSTPLQALALLNETQMVEAARFLGRRMLTEGGGSAAWAFRVVTGRRPTDPEAELLTRLHQEQLDEFKKDPAAARKFLAVGDGRADEGLAPADLAAAASVALAILNHDGAVYRR